MGYLKHNFWNRIWLRIIPCHMIVLAATSSLLAALGSGPFVRAGFGLNLLYGTDLYIIPPDNHYSTLPEGSQSFDYKEYANNGLFLTPDFLIGWEQSLNLVLSVNTGVGLAFSGTKWKGVPVYDFSGNQISEPAIDAKLRTTYITVPLETKLMLPLNSGGFYITFGPWFSFLASAKFENSTNTIEMDDKPLFNTTSIGVGCSFGGEVQLRAMDLLMGLRFDAGLTDEAKDESIKLRHSKIALETGLRWTTRRHTKKKWPL